MNIVEEKCGFGVYGRIQNELTEKNAEIERLRADNERLMRCCGKDDMRAEIKRLRDAIAHASEYLAQDASVPTVVNTIAQRLLAGESPEIVYGE